MQHSYIITEAERCAYLTRERDIDMSRFSPASDPLWSLTNTLLHSETRRNACFFGHEGRNGLPIRPPRPPPCAGGVYVQPNGHGGV